MPENKECHMKKGHQGAHENMSPKEYEAHVKQITPTHSLSLNMLKAFITGGIICTIGQALMNFFLSYDMEKKDASACTLLVIILCTVVLTGLNWFSKIAQFGGAGALVPITGFANSVASPAIEYTAEGQVYGIGCKIFTISGPVILYGVFTSWLLGVIYWLLKVMEIM